MKQLTAIFIFFLICIVTSSAQQSYQATPDPDLLKKRWQAEWITHPAISLTDFSVLYFRKTIELEKQPKSFIVNVSGDTRYKLYVNGKQVCFGPAKGDRYHWYFETVDIAPILKAGTNALAAVVWNFGEWTPVAQMSSKTGFILQGNTAAEEIANTNESWKVMLDNSLSLETEYWNYAGCGEKMDGTKYPWGWNTAGFNDSNWSAPRMISRGFPYGLNDEYDWVLTPRDIPLNEDKLLRMETVRRSDGLNVPDNFLKGNSPVEIAPNKKVSFLIDQKVLTTAYPEMVVSKGKGSRIKLTYSEALYNEKGKANRDDIEGRKLHSSD